MVTGSSGYCTLNLRLGMYDKVTPIPWMIAFVDSITSLIIDISSRHFRSRCLPPAVAPDKLIFEIKYYLAVLGLIRNLPGKRGSISSQHYFQIAKLPLV